MICNLFDVVEIPFPFVDQEKTKRRKALVLSSNEFNTANCASILAMITSATHSRWLGDVALVDWKLSGLQKPCFFRLKLFTLDNGLVTKKVGALSLGDRENVAKELRRCLPAFKAEA